MAHWTNIVSVGFGKVASFRFPSFVQRGINALYVRAFGITLEEFESASSYRSLNALFTRKLQKVRSCDQAPESVISPCDSKVNACGRVEEGLELSIKGERYSMEELIHEEPEAGGWSYLNFYLSPRDYHRYHAPFDCVIESAVCVEGKLWPVNRFFMDRIGQIYTKNARVALKGTDQRGKIFHLVFIGALNVGEIIFHRDFASLPWKLEKGDELGYFKMGSSIVLMFQDAELCVSEGEAVKFGETIGTLI